MPGEKERRPILSASTLSVQESHLGLIDVAAFMGLRCSEEQALKVWRSRRMAIRHGDYTNHGLPEETIEWMTITMGKLG